MKIILGMTVIDRNLLVYVVGDNTIAIQTNTSSDTPWCALAVVLP